MHDCSVENVNEVGSKPAREPWWRSGDWWALGPMLLAVFFIHMQLTYLGDVADHFRLGYLIFWSVLFGVSLAQLPPVRYALRGRPKGHRGGRSSGNRTT